jgi:hypothetical protein
VPTATEPCLLCLLVLQVRIPAHCLTSNNRQVRARQLWGSDVYTEDSDLVAVLMHCGYWYHSGGASTQPKVSKSCQARAVARAPCWAGALPHWIELAKLVQFSECWVLAVA